MHFFFLLYNVMYINIGSYLYWKRIKSKFVTKLSCLYRTGQSVDLTVIGNLVFTLSRDLSFPYHVINGSKDRTVLTSHSVACNICKYNIACQIGQSVDFTAIGNHFCCRVASSISYVHKLWWRHSVTFAFAYVVNRSNCFEERKTSDNSAIKASNRKDKKNNHVDGVRIGKPSGWTSRLELAKARSAIRGSPLGCFLSSPHQHDRFSLYLWMIFIFVHLDRLHLHKYHTMTLTTPVGWLSLLQLTVLSGSVIVMLLNFFGGVLCCHVPFWIFLWVYGLFLLIFRMFRVKIALKRRALRNVIMLLLITSLAKKRETGVKSVM